MLLSCFCFFLQEILLGDCTKATTNLKWTRNYTFQSLVEEMVNSDLKLMKTNPNA